MEGFAQPYGKTTHKDGHEAVGHGWELNTGAIATKKTSVGLLEEWVQAYLNRRLLHGSGEQNSLMVAIQNNPKYRFYPLPPLFNFRRGTIYSFTGPQIPLMLHTHTFSNLSGKKDSRKFNLTNYKDVAKHASILMFEDCYNHMRHGAAPLTFLCDTLTA